MSLPLELALAQFNPVVGDLDGNAARILALYREAVAAGAGIVVFPELALTGYPPRDLLDRPSFVAAAAAALDALAAATVPSTALVVGAPLLRDGALCNCAVAACDGRIEHVQSKVLLPYYDVFDETRYFQPGAPGDVWTHRGHKIGLMVCEDAWRVPGQPSRQYLEDPVAALAAAGAGLFVNISASPFQLGKSRVRERIACFHAAQYGLPFVLVNQVGGNDELIFDGGSLVAWPDGRIERAGRFVEELRHVTVEPGKVPSGSGTLRKAAAADTVHAIDCGELYGALVLGVRDYAAKCGFRGALIGLSGGIDSALTAVIAADALGAENVVGVTMPSKYSSAGSVEDSRALAANLGMRLETIPIGGIVDAFGTALAPLFAGTETGIAEENVQARIRGTLLMSLSNKFGWLLLSTGNKSELSMGYCTLYGDMNGGLAVLGDVLKTVVFRLSRWVNRDREIIPLSTLEKPPSAELRPDQKDSDSLPEYDLLDAILTPYLEEQLAVDAIIARGFEPDLVRRIIALVDRNEYKRRQAPPVLRVTGKAFGSGRRMPIAARTTQH